MLAWCVHVACACVVYLLFIVGMTRCSVLCQQSISSLQPHPSPTDCPSTQVCAGASSKVVCGWVRREGSCHVSCLLNISFPLPTDCGPTDECTQAKGKCKSVCGCGEHELANGCTGAGCKCCIADIPDCPLKQNGCKSCMFTPLCTGSAPTEFCPSGPDCSCCPP